MDIIFIRELRVETVIGVYAWERGIKQIVIIDLDIGTDIRQSASSDKIDDTLSYKAVSKRLIEFVGASDYQLIEALAEAIANLVMTEFGVPWLRLRLSKPGAVSAARDVGVVIERGTQID